MKLGHLASAALLALGVTTATTASALPITFTSGFSMLAQTHTGAGTGYLDAFEFTLDQDSSANFGVFSFSPSITNDYDISSVTLVGPTGSFAFTNHTLSSAMEIYSFAPLADLPVGLYTLQVAGSVAPNASIGSFGGNLTVSAVPEPETYSMMIVGLAGIGFVLRRRRSTSIANACLA